MTRAEYQTTKEISEGLFISVTVEDIKEVLTYHEKQDETDFFEALWFETGSYVKTKDSSEIWQIVSIEKKDNKWWIIYYAKINFLDKEKKINLLSLPYEYIFNVFKKDNKELKYILSTITLELIDREEAEMIIELQEAIREMDDDDLLDFVESWEIAETDLPYIDGFLLEEVERRKNN